MLFQGYKLPVIGKFWGLMYRMMTVVNNTTVLYT